MECTMRNEKRNEQTNKQTNANEWSGRWIDGWKKRAIAGRLFCALEMLKSELTFCIYESID